MPRILLVVNPEGRRPDAKRGPGRWFAGPHSQGRTVPEETAITIDGLPARVDTMDGGSLPPEDGGLTWER